MKIAYQRPADDGSASHTQGLRDYSDALRRNTRVVSVHKPSLRTNSRGFAD
jgi:hypothetical protein